MLGRADSSGGGATMTTQPRNTDRRGRKARGGRLPARHLSWYYGWLLGMVIALVGGIIWYNSKKTNELAIAAAERLTLETKKKFWIG